MVITTYNIDNDINYTGNKNKLIYKKAINKTIVSLRETLDMIFHFQHLKAMIKVPVIDFKCNTGKQYRQQC